MATVVDWTLDRPPILGIDFPDDHANGERARDLWYECRRRPTDEPLPVVDLLASEAVQKQQRHERSLLWKKALRRYNNTQRDPEMKAQRTWSDRLITNQEQERQIELTRVTGQYYYSPQERHLKSRVRGLQSDMIVV